MGSVLNDPELNRRETPQRIQARSDEVRNNAGGYVFSVDDAVRLSRFLVLGTEAGTYYVDRKKHTLDNVEVVRRMVSDDVAGREAVRIATEISVSGRAPSNDPALYTLAVASASPHETVRDAAFLAMPQVARIGTHLFTFAEFMKANRGWGSKPHKAFEGWYLDKEVTDLALQLVKYRQRNGWTHRDILRHVRPTGAAHGSSRTRHRRTPSPVQDILLNFAADRLTLERLREYEAVPVPRVVEGYLRAAALGDKITAKQAVSLVTEYRLPREALPDAAVKYPEVWQAMLDSKALGLTAIIRNLPTLTNLGVVTQSNNATRQIRELLGDPGKLRSARVHPFSLLVALKTYARGRSVRGSATWTPVQQIVDALDQAFYLSYGSIQPTNKNIHLALDVSGSMDWSMLANGVLSAREAVAAMALVTANVEPNYEIWGFSTTYKPLAISPRQRLDQVTSYMAGLPFGGTDASLPAKHAMKRRDKVDAFVVYTDSETWAGGEHPWQALRRYREATGIQAKQIVVGTTATDFSIADPTDPLQLDVVGMDAAVPTILSEFITG